MVLCHQNFDHAKTLQPDLWHFDKPTSDGRCGVYVFKEKRLRASSRQQENRGLKRKKISQHQFRAVQNFLGCPHPENRHALNDRSISRQVSPTTPHEPPTATAPVKKFIGMNGRTQPTQRDTLKPTAKFTSTPTARKFGTRAMLAGWLIGLAKLLNF
jgi:hypothetical protein